MRAGAPPCKRSLRMPPPNDVLDRIHSEMARLASSAQSEICAALERVDGGVRFGADLWKRAGGGGGLSRVAEGGAVVEKAGVNVSDVHGELEPALAAALPGGGARFVAAGVSVVVHPRSPMVPTAHMNVRFLARGEKAWFGGGADLTPHYLFAEDCAHFHRVLREACERHTPGSFAAMKRAADAYFFLPHRGEHRGVGGIFFDDLAGDLDRALAFVADVPRAFLAAYLPIVERRKGLPHGEAERRWQEIRRGRYVEFNLVHDRGTLFGLKTGGRIESVLMSLPPRVRFEYDDRPAPGSREAEMLEVLRIPREWV
jgi:coproporphyrinogen III oxidase